MNSGDGLSLIQRKVGSGEILGVVWDWGDTLMRDIPGQTGPMADWPRVEAMPGASMALEAFAVGSPGVIQCLATNAADSGSEQVARALGRVGLRGRLARFFTSSELGTSKPDPAFFEEVARQLGAPSSRLLAVGNDYHKDVAPAKAAGMVTVLVSSATDPRLHPAADLVVPDLQHLAAIVQHGHSRD